MSAIEIVTKQDLDAFKVEILSEFKKMIQPIQPEPRRWLKTYQVREMLGNMSAGTLQTMRNKGILRYSLINGLALYEYSDVIRLMEELKIPIPERGRRRNLTGK